MVKMVSFSEEAYKRLKAMKGDKSFSEIVLEITDERLAKRKNIMKFAGIWADRSDEWEKIKKKIYEDRKKFKLREVKF